ncbi:MAG: multiprotein bridging factor aMBF1 [Halobacteriaceae archaeon]
MVQCEMCGAETPWPKTVKIEGAELDVCEDCAELGTEVKTESAESTSTKYSTSSSGGGGTSGDSGGSTGGGGGGGSGGRRRDMFDEMDTLADDYDQRIREAREARDLSQEDLAGELNEKASLIRKLERGDVLPSDEVQGKLERALDIDLSGEAAGDTDEWEAGDGPGGLTLGDMVKRKD